MMSAAAVVCLCCRHTASWPVLCYRLVLQPSDLAAVCTQALRPCASAYMALLQACRCCCLTLTIEKAAAWASSGWLFCCSKENSCMKPLASAGLQGTWAQRVRSC